MPMKKIMIVVSLAVILGTVGTMGYQGWKFYERQKLEEERLKRRSEERHV